MNDSTLSTENIIFITSNASDKIYVREQKGVFQRIRRRLGCILIAVFIGIPFIKINGYQAVYFDLQQQQFNFFSLTFFPQDFLIVSLLLILAAFALFYVTKFYGRVWCGFTCPQTIWMLLFTWVERRVEGSHNKSKSLDAQSINVKKVIKKTIKHVIWLGISLFTALAFISYFVEVDKLYKQFFTFEASSLISHWVVFFTVCTYINAGWIKDKMCQHMCPYARFQSAMFDKSTKLVSYNNQRGENRGKRKRSQMVEPSMGDCVDCNLCVQVCPVGIDIREGLQYECINCGLCVDACDTTMDKFNYDKGLIKFTSEVPSTKGWKRHLSYGGFITLFVAMIVTWIFTWQSFEVSVLRDRQALFRINQSGDIENTYTFKIRNKLNKKKEYRILIEGLDAAKFIKLPKIEVLPKELKTFTLTVAIDKPLNVSKQRIDFEILNIADNDSVDKSTYFYSGKGGW